MNKEIEEQITRFVQKHKLGSHDKVMQAIEAVEEANELVQAAMSAEGKMFSDYRVHDEKEEVADVVITALVYAGLSGFLDEVDELVKKKMLINLEKPARERVGVKVNKGCHTGYLD